MNTRGSTGNLERALRRRKELCMSKQKSSKPIYTDEMIEQRIIGELLFAEILRKGEYKNDLKKQR